MNNPLKKHIVSYVEFWKCVSLNQIRGQRFAEKGYYDEKCGEFENLLDELIEEGTIRRVKFEVGIDVVTLLMPQHAKFKGWC